MGSDGGQTTSLQLAEFTLPVSIDQFALQPAALEPSRVRLAALDLQLAERERELAREKTELHELQSRYLREIGGLYEELAKLQAAVEAAEIRAGIRPPADDDRRVRG